MAKKNWLGMLVMSCSAKNIYNFSYEWKIKPMRRLILTVIFIASFFITPKAYSIDWISDVFWNIGYVYSPKTPFGFNLGLAGFDVAASTYKEDEEDVTKQFQQVSLSYGVKIFDWLRVPAGISFYYEGGVSEATWGFNVGAEFIVNPFSDNWKLSIKAQTINFTHFFAGAGIVYISKSETPPPKTPAKRPSRYPTLTPEELRKVEIAYEPAIKLIEQAGKRLVINNMSERAEFIKLCQGSPDTAAVNRAKNIKLPYYDTSTITAQNIVNLAKQEPNLFLRTRMIHDWVSDTFSYDYDLLWWMDNVSGKNEDFTLDAIAQRQRGVCLEYAILFCFLMNAAGVDTYLICDSSEPGIGHAYNMVVIDDTGYIIDTTWDSGNCYKDGRIQQFKRMISKDYFMPSVYRSYKLRNW